ncbi:MAG: hypothetical protein MK212_03195 [Saprospiraceae bacterium]|nr:hypothetical protein [Saprospiraceae bacterium]
MKSTFSILALFLCSISLLSAQTTASIDSEASEYDFSDFELVPEEAVTYSSSNDVDWEDFEIEVEEQNWVIHTDLTKKIVYVDFEELGGKMKTIQLKDQKNAVLLEDDTLFDLPVNTIYEISLKDLSEETYFVELHTYNGVYRQEIKLSK